MSKLNTNPDHENSYKQTPYTNLIKYNQNPNHLYCQPQTKPTHHHSPPTRSRPINHIKIIGCYEEPTTKEPAHLQPSQGEQKYRVSDLAMGVCLIETERRERERVSSIKPRDLSLTHSPPPLSLSLSLSLLFCFLFLV